MSVLAICGQDDIVVALSAALDGKLRTSRTAVSGELLIEPRGSGTSNAQEHALGLALAWLLLNKPLDASCSLRLEGRADADSLPVVIHASPAAVAAAAAATAATAKAAPSPTPTEPSSCVEVYHLHAHFNSVPGSEAAARELLGAVRAALARADETALHEHVWYAKNGPHDPWSWELWVENDRALGIAAAELARGAGSL